MTALLSGRPRVSCRLAALATLGALVSGCGAAQSGRPVADAAVRQQIADLGRPAPDVIGVLAVDAAQDPSDTQAQFRYAKALGDAGRNKEALEVARAAAPDAKGNAELASLTGMLQLRLQDAAGAEATYRQILTRTPEDIEALNGLGIAEIMQGALDKAEQDFRRAVALVPSDTRSANNVALTLALQGRTQEAIPLLEAMLKVEPGSDRTRHNLALTYAIAGHRTEAMAVLGAIMTPEEAERTVNADVQAGIARGIGVMGRTGTAGMSSVAVDPVKLAPGRKP